VSSGLKWALYSNSVVLMPPATYTSWAMEELLEPWVHYVPIHNDLEDVEDKVQWVIDHPVLAMAIAQAGKLWISDLVYHPYADDDDNAIMREMFLRYQQHFEYDPDLATFDNLAFH
jgi:Glycosyl transferase family 90